MADYNKVALLVTNNNGILMCRKNNTTSKLILPGGCIEAGESATECLNRELKEELGDSVSVTGLEHIGTYTDIAANDDPSIRKTLEIKLFSGNLTGKPAASSEIVELVWFGKDADRRELTAIMINKIIPDLEKRNMLPWQR
ncbi:MAG: NUDIX domain-containing protein [Spirochaetes bacterium]|nr:NUDIX domain-containing protein [Spirochaetota bacterium]